MPTSPEQGRSTASSWWPLIAAGLGVAILGAIFWNSSGEAVEYSEVTPVPVDGTAANTPGLNPVEPQQSAQPVASPDGLAQTFDAPVQAKVDSDSDPKRDGRESIIDSQPPAVTDSATLAVRKPRNKRKTRRRVEEPSTSAVVVGEGTIVLRVKPWGTVFLDGKRLGNTPMVRQILTSSGNHVVKVLHPSLGERSSTVRVKPDQTVAMTFDLRE